MFLLKDFLAVELNNECTIISFFAFSFTTWFRIWWIRFFESDVGKSACDVDIKCGLSPCLILE